LHLDSQDRINAFADKDLQLVKSISNQTAIAIENCKLLQDIEKEVQVRENLGRFLPPHVVDRCIDRGEEPIRKGGRQTHGTILFADIRGFTELSEKKSPQEVVDLLNDFFERLVQIVFKYDGVLDKYIGDCLMAAFGTLPGQEENAPLKAVLAAMEFRKAIDEMNEDRQRLGKEPVSIGVGLNTGQLTAFMFPY
jgi:adenylate cyclase